MVVTQTRASKRRKNERGALIVKIIKKPKRKMKWVSLNRLKHLKTKGELNKILNLMKKGELDLYRARRGEEFKTFYWKAVKLVEKKFGDVAADNFRDIYQQKFKFQYEKPEQIRSHFAIIGEGKLVVSKKRKPRYRYAPKMEVRLQNWGELKEIGIPVARLIGFGKKSVDSKGKTRPQKIFFEKLKKVEGTIEDKIKYMPQILEIMGKLSKKKYGYDWFDIRNLGIDKKGNVKLLDFSHNFSKSGNSSKEIFKTSISKLFKGVIRPGRPKINNHILKGQFGLINLIKKEITKNPNLQKLGKEWVGEMEQVEKEIRDFNKQT